MYAEIKENKSGDKVCVFKKNEGPMMIGSKVEFLKGSDCPNGKAECTDIKLTGVLEFKNIEEENSVKFFTVHIEDFSEDVKKEYSKIL